jgi:hypothetical protein
LQTDFWTLDVIWWKILDRTEAIEDSVVPVGPDLNTTSTPVSNNRFRLERELETFLLENWDHTDLGKDWQIYSTPEDPDAGNQFPTDVGRIDILAIHKSEPRVLVIELKRDQSSDATVGQALRYIGWIKKNLDIAQAKTVEGLIIAHEMDKQTIYALSTLEHVKLLTYEVQFTLKKPPQVTA